MVRLQGSPPFRRFGPVITLFKRGFPLTVRDHPIRDLAFLQEGQLGDKTAHIALITDLGNERVFALFQSPTKIDLFGLFPGIAARKSLPVQVKRHAVVTGGSQPPLAGRRFKIDRKAIILRHIIAPNPLGLWTTPPIDVGGHVLCRFCLLIRDL